MALSPTDGFVLSRVDGIVNERDLIASIGLPAEQVQASLATLESHGLITYANGQPSPTASGAVQASPEARRLSSVSLRAATSPVSPSPVSPAPAAPPVTPAAPASGPALRGPSGSDSPLTAAEDEAALAEPVDLEEGEKRAVLAVHARLVRVDHYSLLGIDREADRKGIKRAYYELAGQFHPDKYFRRKLGSFKGKMEAIFSRITLAHDTLADREKRVEYDAYLQERRRNRSPEELMADALDEVRRVEQAVENAARAEERPPAVGPAVPVAQASASPTPAGASAAPPPNVDIAARRDALARRLLGGRAAISSAPPARITSGTSSGPPAAPAPMSAAEAMGALRRRYEERVAQAKASEARKYATNARAALAAGDALGAATGYRVAMQLAPDDADLAREAQAAQAKADVVLGETYTKQAEYEERSGQWPEAARSWARVCKARPNDVHAHERGGHALLMAGTDLHEAARLMKRACELEPGKTGARVILAKIYLAAGLELAAKRELETAAQLAPQDDTIRSMLKKL
jgi:curved DNA-binding protein CbpA